VRPELPWDEDRVMTDDSSTSLSRAIAILTVLGSPEGTDADGIGVVQIARLIGREKTQVSRTLKTLAEAGFVLRDQETLRYRLGWRGVTPAARAAGEPAVTGGPPGLRHPGGPGGGASPPSGAGGGRGVALPS